MWWRELLGRNEIWRTLITYLELIKNAWKEKDADWFASWQLHWNVWLISLVNFRVRSFFLLFIIALFNDWWQVPQRIFLFLFFCIPQTRFDSWKNDGGVDSFKTKRGIFMEGGIIRWQPTGCIAPKNSRLNPKSKQSVCDSKKRSNNTIRIGLANNLIVFQFTLLRKTKNVQRKM